MKAARLSHLLCALLICISFLATGHDSMAAADTSAHAQLDQILNRPEYAAWQLRQRGQLPQGVDYSDAWTKQLLRPFRELRDFLKWLFNGRAHNRAFPAGPSAESLSDLVEVLVWVAVLGLLLFLGIVLFKILATRPQSVNMATVLSREQIRQAMESGDALALGSAQWMDEARRLASEQDFRAVYRALYLALLSGLHGAGKIDHNRNRTNWVYVQHYRGPEPERARFSELTDLFDRVWYGRQPGDAQNLDQLRMDVDLLTRGGSAA